MRAVKEYFFHAANKVRFSELPGIVHRFADENGLNIGRFLYYFEELTVPHFRKRNACAEEFFNAVSEFERERFSKLDELFDPTPEWFSPDR